MGVSNFTNSNGASGSPGGSGSGTGGPPIMPPPMPQQDDDADVKALLINYNDRFASASPALFRDEVIMQTMSAMVSKKKPNALLIGPAGCGKTAVAEEIARRIASGDQSVPPALRQMTVYELPISSLVAGTSMAGSLEARLKSVIDFARKRSNHAILFIDEIHMVVNDRSTIYSGIAQILKPALARSDLRVIGSTTTQESRALDKDPAFKRRFSKVVVEELTSEQTRVILDSVLTGLLDHYDHKVSVTPDVLDQVVVSADKVMTGHRPDTALTLLDRAMGEVVVSHHDQIHRALAAGDTDRRPPGDRAVPAPGDVCRRAGAGAVGHQGAGGCSRRTGPGAAQALARPVPAQAAHGVDVRRALRRGQVRDREDHLTTGDR